MADIEPKKADIEKIKYKMQHKLSPNSSTQS